MREKGKCYRKTKNGKYEAYISNHGRSISLGTYIDECDAINAVAGIQDGLENLDPDIVDKLKDIGNPNPLTTEELRKLLHKED